MDSRTLIEKLQDMAAMGTPPEQEIAKAKLQTMGVRQPPPPPPTRNAAPAPEPDPFDAPWSWSTSSSSNTIFTGSIRINIRFTGNW